MHTTIIKSTITDSNTQLLENHNYITIIVVVVGVSAGILIIFPFCFYGKLATESFDKMTDVIWDLNWLVLPLALQKYIILLLANMQMTMYYHGFEIITLDLNTFVRVSTVWVFHS